MPRNCNLSWFTSDAVKPAESKRSKPRGGADVVIGIGDPPVDVFRSSAPGGVKPREEVVREAEDVGGGRAAAFASLTSSEGESSSPMLQLT